MYSLLWYILLVVILCLSGRCNGSTRHRRLVMLWSTRRSDTSLCCGTQEEHRARLFWHESVLYLLLNITTYLFFKLIIYTLQWWANLTSQSDIKISDLSFLNPKYHGPNLSHKFQFENSKSQSNPNLRFFHKCIKINYDFVIPVIFVLYWSLCDACTLYM